MASVLPICPIHPLQIKDTQDHAVSTVTDEKVCKCRKRALPGQVHQPIQYQSDENGRPLPDISRRLYERCHLEKPLLASLTLIASDFFGFKLKMDQTEETLKNDTMDYLKAMVNIISPKKEFQKELEELDQAVSKCILRHTSIDFRKESEVGSSLSREAKDLIERLSLARHDHPQAVKLSVLAEELTHIITLFGTRPQRGFRFQ